MQLDSLTLWIVVGLVLIAGEMLTGTFYLLFLSVGAFAAALSAHLQQPALVQAIVCGTTAVLTTVFFKKRMQDKIMKSLPMDNDVGKTIQIDQDIESGHTNRVSYQGTTWVAKNVGNDSLKSGDTALIVGIDGNTLLLRKK